MLIDWEIYNYLHTINIDLVLMGILNDWFIEISSVNH